MTNPSMGAVAAPAWSVWRVVVVALTMPIVLTGLSWALGVRDGMAPQPVILTAEAAAVGCALWLLGEGPARTRFTLLGLRAVDPLRGSLGALVFDGIKASLVALVAAGILTAALRATVPAIFEAGEPSFVRLQEPAHRIVFAILLAVVTAPVAEEIVFRGVIYRRLRRRIGMGAAGVISGLLFASLHLQPENVFVYLGAGLVAAWLVERSGSIVPGIIVHAVNNAVVVAVGLLRG